MRHDSETVSRIRSAFPTTVAVEVDHVLETIDPGKFAPTEHDIGRITVGGEVVRIPSRVYFPEPCVPHRASLSSIQEQILACIYTRHHDGHVRERAIKQVISSSTVWAPPFVIQLLGEYVIEIIQNIHAHAEELRQPSYRRFIAENPGFISLTRQRATSYWNCHYRGVWPRKDDYPSLQLLNDCAAAGAGA